MHDKLHNKVGGLRRADSLPPVRGQRDVPVAMDAKITDGKKEIGLTDLKAGMRVTLQLTVRDNQITVIGISTGDKER